MTATTQQPRPSLSSHRPTVDLTGTWQFWPDLADSTTSLDAEFVNDAERSAALGAPRDIEVPSVWQAQFEDLRLWSGTAWYERSADVPAEWTNGRIRLHFGAVDYLATVWVNGQHVADHEGGYLPFHVDVTDVVTVGEPCTVSVRVHDPRGVWPADVTNPFVHSEADDQFVPFHEIPHGKQSWYGPLSGLWQPVWLEHSHEVWVRHALLHGDVDAAALHVRPLLGAPATGMEQLRVTVTGPAGEVVATWEGDATAAHLSVPVESPELWSPDAPNLYTARLELLQDGDVVDVWSDTFGFRSVAVRDGKVLLNGEPVYVRGALDQDYYPGTIATPPSDELLDEQIERAKELGLNLLRCHIKAPDPRYLYAADRAGMLVWQEAPNWISFNPRSTERGMATLRGMIERDFNHPSTIIWTIMNESWGIDIAGNAEHRAWLLETFDEIKALDPTRLVVDNSPCEPSFHVKTDLNDFHYYQAIPEHAREWSAWTRNFAERPEYGFSTTGDAQRTGREPVIVSEFGNWGLPDVDALLDEDGRQPWWFDTGNGWNDSAAVHPRGIKERFGAWGLERVYGSWEAFVRSSQEHEWECLKYEIEDMRTHGTISGYVVTELTDVHWEANGLLDLNRGRKCFHERFHRVNGDDVLAPVPASWRVRAGERVRVTVHGSCWSGQAGAGSQVRWSIPELGAAGTLDATVERASVRDLGVVEALVPHDLAGPTRLTLELEWLDGAGTTLTRNDCALLAFPAAAAGSAPAHDDIAVAASWDDVREHVAAGGRAVVCLRDDSPVPGDGSLSFVRATRGMHRGEDAFHADWAQGSTFLAPALRDGLALRERIDLPFIGITPWAGIGGIDPTHAGDVLAGSYVGWLQHLAAVVLAVRHGDGIAIITTFDLLEHPDDPLAESLLARLRELAADTALTPSTEVD